MWMCTVVLISLKKKKVKKGKKEQLKDFVFLLYNEEGREVFKGKFNMPGLRGEKESKLGSNFFVSSRRT